MSETKKVCPYCGGSVFWSEFTESWECQDCKWSSDPCKESDASQLVPNQLVPEVDSSNDPGVLDPDSTC